MRPLSSAQPDTSESIRRNTYVESKGSEAVGIRSRRPFCFFPPLPTRPRGTTEMYAIDINRDIDIEFAELVEPVAVRAPKPRCADGHRTSTPRSSPATPPPLVPPPAIRT